ncbi:Pc20g10680 [Penicillium rubens Wisconsin 54-1255]|uniref:Pc20g10680 protein n=1 Tax=Penicillium rubens (strain ATCC 28089 / DSM 1075 / NRRL 1951 / Wisconsin 54-1255) TaxID=500485 RepID=B6HFW1_PENRW|nr:Pc20g10680 [Penicillium rubens Wisconsin 54-1255]
MAGEDSLVVTHPTTNSPACGLSTAERTGSPIFHTLWSYVSGFVFKRMIERAKLESIGYRRGRYVYVRCKQHISTKLIKQPKRTLLQSELIFVVTSCTFSY